jgi:hypothetical protein
MKHILPYQMIQKDNNMICFEVLEVHLDEIHLVVDFDDE